MGPNSKSKTKGSNTARRNVAEAKGEVAVAGQAETHVSSSSQAAAPTSSDEMDIDDAMSDTEAATNTAAKQMTPQEAFEDFYLRQMTREFADDIEKLPSGADFKGERSVDVLVEALKQGGACFKMEERERIGRAAAAQMR